MCVCASVLYQLCIECHVPTVHNRNNTCSKKIIHGAPHAANLLALASAAWAESTWRGWIEAGSTQVDQKTWRGPVGHLGVCVSGRFNHLGPRWEQQQPNSTFFRCARNFGAFFRATPPSIFTRNKTKTFGTSLTKSAHTRCGNVQQWTRYVTKQIVKIKLETSIRKSWDFHAKVWDKHM